MRKAHPFIRSAAGLLVGLLVAAAVAAQPTPAPHHYQEYGLDSGPLLGTKAADGEPEVIYREVVAAPGAPWLRLLFGPSRLGRTGTLVLTSLEDGASQVLTAESLEAWGHASAFFNGSAVEVALVSVPAEPRLRLRIDRLMVGERPSSLRLKGGGLGVKTICGTTDDRVSSNDPGVGRIVPIGCTGWNVTNGAHLTAGHCDRFDAQILEFNVPASQSDGTIVHPPPQDQYPIVASSFVSAATGIGNDWAVFATNPNSNTGLRAVLAQGKAFRMSRDSTSTNLRVTGYGVDGPPPDFGRFSFSPRNSDSQTQQTHVGPNAGETVSGANDAFWRYAVDTQPGNSGSPLVANDAQALTLGIHTHGGCGTGGGNNHGTSFEHDGLETAIQGFPGANVVYVDGGHPVTPKDGTVMRPFSTVGQGATAVPTGGQVSIVSGTYDETLTLDRAMTLTAPVGLVRIE